MRGEGGGADEGRFVVYRSFIPGVKCILTLATCLHASLDSFLGV